MTVRVELRECGAVVDGVESWWDDVDLALGDRRDDYPFLSRVDAYENVHFMADELPGLLADLRRFGETVARAPRPLIEKLEALCETGIAATAAELWFRGD